MRYICYGVVALWSMSLCGMQEIQVNRQQQPAKEMLIAAYGIVDLGKFCRCVVVEKQGTQCKQIGGCDVPLTEFNQYAENAQFILVLPGKKELIVKKVSIQSLIADMPIIASPSDEHTRHMYPVSALSEITHMHTEPVATERRVNVVRIMPLVGITVYVFALSAMLYKWV